MATLAELVASVEGKEEVYAADLGSAKKVPVVIAPAEVAPTESPENKALDGVAWHVFNTLRGVEDTPPGGITFEEIRNELIRSGNF